MSLGRSTANNVVIDRAAVSKLHARIQRTGDQLVLQDLGSANGTFVNDARVMTAMLDDGDELSLANVARFRLRVEWGEVKASISGRTLVPMPAPRLDVPEFSREWKTRYEWDSAERAVIEELRAEAPVPGESTEPGPPRPPRPPAPKQPKPAAPAPPGIASVQISADGVALRVDAPGSYDIGRADDAPLRLPHPTVSRRHARLVLAADRASATLENLSATTPTLLNGDVVESPKMLKNGDVVTVAEVRLTVTLTR